MRIFLKWNFRTLTSDLPRLLLTVLSIAVTFMLLSGTGVTLTGLAAYRGLEFGGIPRFLETILTVMLQIVFAVTMYADFSVSLAERRSQFRIMQTAGCTKKQVLFGLTVEALALDIVGGLIGAALSFLLAFFQLGNGGVPVQNEMFWNGSVWIKNILPAFLSVPPVMLVASVQLFRPERGKSNVHGKSVLRRGSVRLFGIGGCVERALTKNERRNHRALSLALGTGLAVVMLTTACLFLLMNSIPVEADGKDVWLSYYGDSGNDAEMTARLDELLSEGLNDGSVGKVSVSESYLAQCFALIDKTQITDEVADRCFSDPDAAHGNTACTVFPYDDGRVFACITLYFVDDETFGKAAEAAGMNVSGDSPILIDYAVTGKRVYRLRKQIPADVTLSFCRRDIWERTGSFYTKQEVFDPATIGNAAPDRIVSVSVPVDKLYVSADNPAFLNNCGINMNLGSYPALVFPAHMRSSFDTWLSADGVIKSRYIRLETDKPALLCKKLSESLNGLSGYETSDFHFGGGPGQLYSGASLYDSVKDRTVMNRILINNVRKWESDYRFFRSSVKGFYGVLLLLVSVAAGLNIVNTVHLNRLSRRQEYAVLVSVGLSPRQKKQMLLTESLRYSVTGVLLGFVLVSVFVYPLYNMFVSVMNWEYMKLADYVTLSPDIYTKGSFSYILALIVNVWENLIRIWARYFTPVAGFMLFLFAGFMLAEHLAMKKLEKDELVITLKDDMHE